MGKIKKLMDKAKMKMLEHKIIEIRDRIFKIIGLFAEGHYRPNDKYMIRFRFHDECFDYYLDYDFEDIEKAVFFLKGIEAGCHLTKRMS